jgi:predicted metalloprotease with PDZ domain
MLALILALALQLASPVVYEVSFPNAAHHEAEVRVTFSNLPPGTLQIRMSRSSPGRYALHEFAKNVYSVTAHDGAGRELRILRPDPYGWDVPNHDGTVVFAYTLYADRADGTYSGIDMTHAHLNMPATFAWARGLEDRPIRITFQPPHGTDWRTATQLAPTADPLTFTAPSLDYFLDSPTELSDFALREWAVSDGRAAYTIRVAMHHQGSETELELYVDWTRRLVTEARDVFGEYPRFDYGTYTFIADYLPWVNGDGMEHRNSTILASTRSLEQASMGLLGTVAHEFFHAWNVERIRPRSLEPFDFERANMSDALWFAEGFTSYYGGLLMRRVGMFGDAEYARRMSNTVSTVLLSPARGFYSVVGMSRQAPFVDQARSVDPTNRDNTFISYYTWGSALALALDLTLRTEFDRLDLDAYMRAVWQRHGKTETPYTVDDLEDILGELTGDPAFAGAFFRDYVHGQEAPDFEALLAHAGFSLRQAHPGQASLGWAELDYDDRGAELTSTTIIGTPLYDAGIDRGSVILRLDGVRLSSDADLSRVIGKHRPGDAVEIVFEERGREVRVELTLEENRWLAIVPYEDVGLALTPEMSRFRESWLGGLGR